MQKTIIFILSAGRSGSTVFDKFLGSNSQTFSVGELKNLSQELNKDSYCGCGANISDCTFWSKIVTKVKDNNKIDFNTKFQIGITNFLRRSLNFFIFLLNLSSIVKKLDYKNEKAINTTIDIYELIFNKISEPILIDSSKDILRALILKKRLSSKYNFRFIYLVRDGRANVYSQLKTKTRIERFNPTTGNTEIIIKDASRKVDTKTAIKTWKNVNKKIITLLKIFAKEDFIKIRYEEFVNNPNGVIEDNASFLGIDWEEMMLSLNNKIHHMVGGNASRLNAKRIYSSPENWKVNLSNNQLKLFEKKAGKLNRKLGYM